MSFPADQSRNSTGPEHLQLAAGQRLFNRRYELKKMLAPGGMGVVWLAFDDNVQKLVALKFLPSILVHHEKEMQRLRAEVNAGQKLRHALIVATYGLEIEGPLAAIVLEYVEGETLKQKLEAQERGFFEPHEIEPWLTDILSALSYLHEDKHLLHRDIKPANIIVDSATRARLMDFGISQSIHETLGRHTQTGAAHGTSNTLAYASPESLRPRHKPAVTDDIYSFGATLYELLTGTPPFYKGATAIIALHIEKEPVPTVMERRTELVEDKVNKTTGDKVGERWQIIIRDCLAKYPERRPQSVKAINWRKAKELPGNSMSFDAINAAIKNATPPTISASGGCVSRHNKITSPALPAQKGKVSPTATAAEIIVTHPSTQQGKSTQKRNLNPPLEIASPQTKTQPPAQHVEYKSPTSHPTRPRTSYLLKAVCLALVICAYAWWSRSHSEAERQRQTPIAETDRVLQAKSDADALAERQRKQQAEELAKPKPSNQPAPKADPQPMPPPPKAEPIKELTLMERLTTEGNSLGMKFIHFGDLPGAKVLGCEHETRSKDYAAFMTDWDYRINGTDADDWRNNVYRSSKSQQNEGIPVGRGEDERAENSSHPVCKVSFDDARTFCEWLTLKERKEGRIGTKDSYRLPTDYEWSLMVGIADKEDPNAAPYTKINSAPDIYPWGAPRTGNYADETARAAFGADWGTIANYKDNFATTAPVKQFAPNKLGFYDLGGNVWEWCDDWYDGNNGEKKYRVARGASWFCNGESLMLSSYRVFNEPALRAYDIGFRVVVVVSDS